MRPAGRCGLLAGFLFFLLAGRAFAQLEGRLYLDKDHYVVGEPIYLNFELTNKGREPLQFASGNSYSFCGGYQIEVSNGPPPSNSSCLSGFAGSCIGGKRVIAPGEVHKDKVLVNYEHDLSKLGTYSINASRTLSYGPPTETWPDAANEERFKVEAQFQIQVEIGNDETLVPIFQPFVAALSSKEEERQREAARIIGSLAPSFLEDTILSMVNSPTTRPFALRGLRHLNTARSRGTLAGIVQGTSGYSYDKQQAIKYLSEMGDQKYFPLLLDEAKKWEPNQARDYVLAAAELGGEDAMPYVVSLLGSSDPFSRGNAIMALPQTDSRYAMPLLIELLRNHDTDQGKLASTGLIQVTHHSPFENGRLYSDSPSSEYSDWAHCWLLHGGSPPIYGPSQCGAVEPLK
jgi:hypothetical protein